jgi:hypothetical protein
MPRKKGQSKAEKAAILKMAPEGSTRIRVSDEFGKEKYRHLDGVLDTDTVLTKRDGSPVVMKGTPGRKGNPRNAPVASEAVADSIRRKDEVLDDDAVLQAAKEAPESSSVLHQVMIQLAEEAASLKFERAEAERRGDSTSNISQRRARILQAVGDTWLKRKAQLVSQGLNLDGPEFSAVFTLVSETFKESMLESGARPEMVETVFAKFASKLSDEWKLEAKRRMKEA